jgi:hypothetical protein
MWYLNPRGQDSSLSSTWQFCGPLGLSRDSGDLPRNGTSDASKPLERRELFLTTSLAKSIKLGVPVRQKVCRSVKLDDLSFSEDHNPIVIDHRPQPVRDRQDCTFGELAKWISVSITGCGSNGSTDCRIVFPINSSVA